MLFNSEEERFEHFLMACEGSGFIPSENFQRWLNENNFFNAPASTKYHGAYAGGLFDHSFDVCGRLIQLTKNNDLKWERPESPFIVGMFHDLCKCDQYIPIIEEERLTDNLDENGNPKVTKIIAGYKYNPDTVLKGHGSKSVALLKALVVLNALVDLTEEEELCIRYHMGVYGNEQEQKEEWAGFDQAIRKYPNVLWTHMADMLASKVDDV